MTERPGLNPFMQTAHLFPIFIFLLFVGGCFDSPRNQIDAPGSFASSSLIAGNFSSADGPTGYAIPIAAADDVEFEGGDRHDRLGSSVIFLLLVSSEGDVEPVLRHAGSAPRYQTRSQDQADGTDTGECLVENATFPCPTRETYHGHAEFPIPRAPSGPHQIPAGHWWFVVIFDQASYYGLTLELTESVMMGSWHQVNVTGGSLRHDWFDAEYQNFEYCRSGSACGEIRNGEYVLTPHPAAFHAYSLFSVKNDYAEVEACWIDDENVIANSCLRLVAPDFPDIESGPRGPGQVPGYAQETTQGASFDRVTLTATNSSYWPDDAFVVTGSYFGFDLPRWPT